jgi:hypothetical protein
MTESHHSREVDMTGYPNNRPARRPVDHSWMVGAWVLPLAIAIVITILTAGFGALTIMVAIMVGVVSTVLHFSKRDA